MSIEQEIFVRGLLAGVLISSLCAIMGVFLILRRMAFLGAGLAHSAFGGVAVALVLGLEPFWVTLIFTLLVANFVQLILSNRKIPPDSAIAVVFSGGMALAVVLIGLSEGFGESVFSYLFGNILMVTWREIAYAVSVGIVVVLFVAFFYRDLVITSFDEGIAKVRGIRIRLVNHLLVSVSSLVIVLSIKLAGILLASSLLVIPSLTALLAGSSFKGSLIISLGASLFATVGGIALSFLMDLPPSGAVVGSMIALFVLSLLWKGFRA